MEPPSREDVPPLPAVPAEPAAPAAPLAPEAPPLPEAPDDPPDPAEPPEPLGGLSEPQAATTKPSTHANIPQPRFVFTFVASTPGRA
jgi:hypothetical protein